MKILKSALFAALYIGLMQITFAQEAKTEAKKETAEPEFKATMAGWEVSLDEAYKKSKATGKPILANFTGSDWCGWCIRLKREVFETQEFKDWAAKNVILLELDFPKRKTIPQTFQQQNASLQQAFGVQGFPTLWVFDASVDPATKRYMLQGIAKTGYVSGGSAVWIKDLENKIAQAKAQQSQAQKKQ